MSSISMRSMIFFRSRFHRLLPSHDTRRPLVDRLARHDPARPKNDDAKQRARADTDWRTWSNGSSLARRDTSDADARFLKALTLAHPR